MGFSIVVCSNGTLQSAVPSVKLWNCRGLDGFSGKNLPAFNSPGCGLLSQRRLARGREEWESAALQNANTKCNGLLPVWGPHVPESAFATCLAR